MLTGLLLVLGLLSGIWLGYAGKPYNGAIFTVHKLIALGTVIAAAVTVYHVRTGGALRSLTVVAVVVTALLFLVMFVSGALLSIGKPAQAAMLLTHRVGLILVTLSVALTAFLLAGGRRA